MVSERASETPVEEARIVPGMPSSLRLSTRTLQPYSEARSPFIVSQRSRVSTGNGDARRAEHELLGGGRY